MSDTKENNSEPVVITTQQYRQIDFLRLFRLCKSLELVNRKRKMPTEYNTGDIEKDQKNARSACRRLLRALIVNIFPDTYTIRSNYNCYHIEFPNDMRDAISFLNSNIRNFERADDEELRNAAVGYRQITDRNRVFIHARVPYSIKINFSNPGVRYGSYVFKPAENFYECAKECVAFQEVWNRYADVMISAVKKYREKPPKINRPRTTSRTTTTTPAVISRLTQAVQQSAETGPRNSQQRFNEALQRLRESRGDDQ
jgi:hypothetical protein